MASRGDGGWLAGAPVEPARVGRARLYREPDAQLVIATYGNGVALSLAARETLRSEGIAVSVLDLRWIAPLPWSDLLAEAERAGRVLIVDECRVSGNVGEALVCGFSERLPSLRTLRVAGADSFVPLGDAAELVLVSEAEIIAAARRLVSL